MKILIGADPEVFLLGPKKELLSAHGMIPGTKAAPFRVSKGAIQVDGTAAEYNIDPVTTADEFIDNNLSVQADMMKHIQKAAPGAVYDFNSLRVYDSAAFKAMPQDCKILGCDPDFNAYTGVPNVMVLDERTPIRTAAGHIHIGWGEGFKTTDPRHFLRCQMMSKALDFGLLWAYNTYIDRNNYQRQQYYGAAGAFRPKSYGVEYRSLSNKWAEKPGLMDRVFRRTLEIVNLVVGGNVPQDAMGYPYGQHCAYQTFWNKFQTI